MDASWTRLPGGGWMRECEGGITLAVEAVADGYEPAVWARDLRAFRAAPVADAAFAAGIALGWLLAMTAAKEAP